MLTIPQLKAIEAEHPYHYEALRRIVEAVNALDRRIGIDPTGAVPAPPAIGSLSVTASNGFFDIAITDNPAGVHQGIAYFVEYDSSPAFPKPRVLYLGPVRNITVQLGSQTLYFRAYSQYFNSLASRPVTFGSPPTAVAGGGSAPPAPQPSQGSGTSTGEQGGSGFGHPIRL